MYVSLSHLRVPEERAAELVAAFRRSFLESPEHFLRHLLD